MLCFILKDRLQTPDRLLALNLSKNVGELVLEERRVVVLKCLGYNLNHFCAHLGRRAGEAFEGKQAPKAGIEGGIGIVEDGGQFRQRTRHGGGA